MCVFLIDIISIIIPFRSWRYFMRYDGDDLRPPQQQGRQILRSPADHFDSAGEALQLSPTKTRNGCWHSMIQQPKIRKLMKKKHDFPHLVIMFNCRNMSDCWSSSSFAQSHC